MKDRELLVLLQLEQALAPRSGSLEQQELFRVRARIARELEQRAQAQADVGLGIKDRRTSLDAWSRESDG